MIKLASKWPLKIDYSYLMAFSGYGLCGFVVAIICVISLCSCLPYESIIHQTPMIALISVKLIFVPNNFRCRGEGQNLIL